MKAAVLPAILLVGAMSWARGEQPGAEEAGVPTCEIRKFFDSGEGFLDFHEKGMEPPFTTSVLLSTGDTRELKEFFTGIMFGVSGGLGSCFGGLGLNLTLFLRGSKQLPIWYEFGVGAGYMPTVWGDEPATGWAGMIGAWVPLDKAFSRGLLFRIFGGDLGLLETKTTNFVTGEVTYESEDLVGWGFVGGYSLDFDPVYVFADAGFVIFTSLPKWARQNKVSVAADLGVGVRFGIRPERR